jgi:hypothetical protein
MSFAASNDLASVAVASLPIVGGYWIAPELRRLSLQRYFFSLTLCGIPFVIGQYSQEDKWGPLWVQYHLLDLSYVPWGTALVMCLILIGAKPFHKRVTKRVLLKRSYLATILFGYVSEFWDTGQAWIIDGQPFTRAVDMGDYTTITIGGITTVVLYVWLRRLTAKGTS